MDSLGIDAATAAIVFTVLAPCSLIGAFGAGWLADRLAGRYLLAVCQACLMTAMLWSVTIGTAWHAYA
jgi:hypothetical protein